MKNWIYVEFDSDRFSANNPNRIFLLHKLAAVLNFQKLPASKWTSGPVTAGGGVGEGWVFLPVDPLFQLYLTRLLQADS